jgi:DNA ligase-1
MLAATAPAYEDLSYPIGVLPKVDGVRSLKENGVAYSRRLKPFPNKPFQKLVASSYERGFNLNGLDGEMITDTDGKLLPNADRDSRGTTLCNRTTSALMDHTKDSLLEWFLFDAQMPGPYVARHDHLLLMQVRGQLPEWVQVIEMQVAAGPEDLRELEALWADQMGYEGMVLRNLKMEYKHGRSTEREQGLLRVTAWTTDEAVILDAEEELENLNELTVSATGHAERSTHKANMRPTGTLGSLKLRALTGKWKDVEFKMGTGWDDELGKVLWAQHLAGTLAGQIVTFRHKEHGAKAAPRFPSFRMIRSPLDM